MKSVRPLMLSLAAVIIPLTVIPASANTFDVEAYRQRERIEQGVRNGSLTYREAAVLREEQARIKQRIVRARRDGRIDPYEMSEIERMQAEASRHIYREKHDVEAQPRRRYGWWHREIH